MEPEERIIQLLDGELGEAEMAELEQLISQNPELKEQKELYEQIILAIQNSGEQSLRKELDGYLRDHLNGNGASKPSPFKKYLFFGGVAACLALAVVFYGTGDKTTDDIPPNWQINEIPTPIDSATIQKDSLQNQLDSLKEINK